MAESHHKDGRVSPIAMAEDEKCSEVAVVAWDSTGEGNVSEGVVALIVAVINLIAIEAVKTVVTVAAHASPTSTSIIDLRVELSSASMGSGVVTSSNNGMNSTPGITLPAINVVGSTS